VKSTIYGRLKQAGPGPRTYHWPIGLEDEYYLQLTAEKQITRHVKGFPKMEWVKVRERNDVLDAECYAYSAAIRAGMAIIDWDKYEQGSPAQQPRSRITQQQQQQQQSLNQPVRSKWMS
jgi:phage terminase large subunit GpA-like protein